MAKSWKIAVVVEAVRSCVVSWRAVHGHTVASKHRCHSNMIDGMRADGAAGVLAERNRDYNPFGEILRTGLSAAKTPEESTVIGISLVSHANVVRRGRRAR